MHRGKGNYYCIVPLCKNTSQNAPQVQFFSLPNDETRRNLWYEACGRKDPLPLSTNTWVCADHFDLKDDVENFWKVQLVKARPRLKPNAVPSKFECQKLNVTAIPKRKKLLEGIRRALDDTSTATSSRDVNVALDTTATYPAAIGIASQPTATFSAAFGVASQPLTTNSPALQASPGTTVTYSSVLKSAPKISAPCCTVVRACANYVAPQPTATYSADFGVASQPSTTNSPALQATPGTTMTYSSVLKSAPKISAPCCTVERACANYVAPQPTATFSADFGVASQPTTTGSPALQATPGTTMTYSSVLKSASKISAPCYTVERASANYVTPQPTATFSAAFNTTPKPIAPRSAVSDGLGSALRSIESISVEPQEIDCSESPAEIICSSEKETVTSLLTIKKEAERRGRKSQTKHFRSKAIQVKSVLQDKCCSPLKVQKIDAAVSPIKSGVTVTEDESSESTLESNHESSDSSYIPSGESESEDDANFKECALLVARENNLKRSMYYLGVREDTMFLIDMLARKLKFRGRHLSQSDVVTLILRKIRLNCPFVQLGDDYGIDDSYAARLFNTHIKSLSAAFSQLIKWLSPDTVFANLPLAFWARYKYTYVLIDCFEIQIQTPGDPFDQSETWSEYKHGNTLKYLIGISPDGTIMYISKGFLGKVSDLEITIKSDFLNFVRGKTVMADRGFKHLEPHLTKINASIVRPPSVSEGQVLDAKTSQEAKRIAALRIHVERSIGRLRQFSFLAPHATIPHQLQNCVDDAVKIACGLVNTHSLLTKL